MSNDYEKWGTLVNLGDAGVQLYQTCGACPEQYQGTVDGNPAYFRLRHSYWRFCIVEPGGNPIGPGMTPEKKVLYFKDGETAGDDDGIMEDAPGLMKMLIAEFRAGTKAPALPVICEQCAAACHDLCPRLWEDGAGLHECTCKNEMHP